MNNRSALDKIRDLIPALPKRDIELAHKFLNNRDFESLQLLVDSSLIRVKKNLRSDSPKEDYLKVDLAELRKLKSLIDIYCEALIIPEQEDDEDYQVY